MNRTFMFTSYFVKEWTRLGFTDDDQIRLEQMLSKNPKLGDVIVGAGGFRKLRFAFEGRGKSGSARVIYLDVSETANIIFVDVYKKSEQENLPQQKIVDLAKVSKLLKGEQLMDEKRYAEFLKGLEEAVEWQKGNIRAHTNYGFKTRQECEELRRLEEEKEQASKKVVI